MTTYFIPAKEDICIGYECEISTMSRGLAAMDLAYPEADLHMIVPFKQVFEPAVCTDDPMGHSVDNIVMMLKENRVRVPYLTKEQIEAKGWELYSKSVDLWFKFKESPITHTRIQELYGYKPYNLFLNYGMHDQKLKIKCDFNGGQDFDGSDTLFEGFCKDINTFRKIINLLYLN